MKPVNLLSPRERPRAATGERQGGAYAALGVLAGLLALVLLYVLTVNQISSREGEVAKVRSEARAAQASAGALESFGQFAQVKETRLQSIRELADGRFDWERLMREISRLLPEEVWLTDLEASSKPVEGAPGAPPGGAGTQPAAAGPALKLVGCAKRQPDVAVMLVRLRRLHRAEDVKLTESKREDSESGGTGGGGSASGAQGAQAAQGAGDAAAVEGCGRSGKHENFKFEASVSFNATPAAAKREGAEKVPVSLGGGS